MNKLTDWVTTLLLALFNGAVVFAFTDQLWRGVTAAILTVGIVYVTVSVANRNAARR